MDDPTSASAQKVNNKYPKRVDEYLTEVLQKFKDRKLLHAMDKLSKKENRRGTNSTPLRAFHLFNPVTPSNTGT